MISLMCRKGATAGAEVTVVISRNSQALLSVRWKGMRISLRGGGVGGDDCPIADRGSGG